MPYARGWHIPPALRGVGTGVGDSAPNSCTGLAPHGPAQGALGFPFSAFRPTTGGSHSHPRLRGGIGERARPSHTGLLDPGEQGPVSPPPQAPWVGREQTACPAGTTAGGEQRRLEKCRRSSTDPIPSHRERRASASPQPAGNRWYKKKKIAIPLMNIDGSRVISINIANYKATSMGG